MKFIPTIVVRRAIASALAALALLAPSFVHAQKSPDEAGRHMIWRVSSDSGVIFVAGSVHALPMSVYPLPSVFNRAFDSATTLVLELELGEDAIASMGPVLLEKGRYQGKETLKDHVSKATYAKLKKRLKEIGLDVSFFATFKPWVVGMLLTSFSTGNSGITAENGLDLHFQKKASEAGIPVVGLETIELQINLFDEMPPKAQEQFLLQQLSDQQSDDKDIMKIIGAWRRGDAESLDTTLGAEMRSDPAFYERLVVGRNLAWIPKIESFLAEGRPVMVVVGALHLVGKDGLIDLLQRKGYRVEQL
jgi:uncharacterized protein YbaP (TraB family)